MKLSPYTFTVPKGDRLVVVNYLSGAIDLVEESDVDEFTTRHAEDRWDGYHLAEYMTERGYLVENGEVHEDLVREKYLEFMDEYEQTPVQLIFATTYACNFRCDYCFQEEYNQHSRILTKEIADAFYRHVNKQFADEPVRPYITLFGGEPLLSGDRYKENLLYFLSQAARFDYAIAIVTNGYDLVDYLADFKRIGVTIKEIQVTLDGDREAHDARRFVKKGEGTFERIASGISKALEAGYRINLRSIIDKQNIESLVRLAETAQNLGWLDYPTERFETTIGRNYELHTCQHTDKLFDRAEMWRDFVVLAERYPILRRYHRPQFHGMRYLSENGELPFPVFDGCPAGKKEWAFDLNGDIYGCTASVGVKQYRLGSYTDPDRETDPEQVLKWQSRDVLAIEECRNCPVSLSCGGGCGVLACNRTGEIHSTDCRPVRELVELGVQYYGIGDEEKG